MANAELNRVPDLSADSGARSNCTADYAALDRAAGIRVLDDRTVVRAFGDDRATFLHGMCSNNVRDAATGTIVPALFLTEHAHVIADCFLWITPNSILMEIERDRWPRTREHIERLLVADDVEFEEASGISVIDLEGARAPEAIRRVGGTDLDEWREAGDDELRCGRIPRFGAPAFTILAPEAKAQDIVAQALDAIPGARGVGPECLEIVRIENGVARVGVDTGEKTIALEARLERYISADKGCYVGQETIERVSARGGLKKRLFGLKFRDANEPIRHASVTLDGKEVGRVTSIARSPRFGSIGLSILYHSAWKPGTVAGAGNGITAEVVDLPFA